MEAFKLFLYFYWSIQIRTCNFISLDIRTWWKLQKVLAWRSFEDNFVYYGFLLNAIMKSWVFPLIPSIFMLKLVLDDDKNLLRGQMYDLNTVIWVHLTIVVWFFFFGKEEVYCTYGFWKKWFLVIYEMWGNSGKFKFFLVLIYLIAINRWSYS